MAPSTQQVAVAAMAAVGCTAFVTAPSTARGPALRSTAQGQASKASASSGTGLAVCGLGAAVGAVIAAPKKQRSALRAFETELGVQPPAGFWDPLGGDEPQKNRRHSTSTCPGFLHHDLRTVFYFCCIAPGRLHQGRRCGLLPPPKICGVEARTCGNVSMHGIYCP